MHGGNRRTSKGKQIAQAVFIKVNKVLKVKKRNDVVRDVFYDIMMPMVMGVLEEEARFLQLADIKDGDLLSPEVIRTFEFKEYQGKCELRAPTLWKMIRDLCGQEDKEADDDGGKKRVLKSRDLNCCMIISSLLHARSNRANFMPTMLGLAAHALHVPKRAMSLFGRLGLTVSYSTLLRLLKKCAEESMGEIRRRVQSGEAYGIVYDNLVFTKRVAAESLLNRENLEKMTVNAMYFLRMPAGVPQGSLELRAGLYNALPGLPRDLCFLSEPREMSVLDILGLAGAATYWAKELESQVLGVLRSYFATEMKREDGIGAKPRTSYRRIPVHRSEFSVLPTLDIDPGTLPGNIEVISEIDSMLGLKGGDLVNRLVTWNGDLFTTAMQNSAKQMRSRDLPEHQLQHVDPWPAYLHAQFAMVSGILTLHMGDSKAWEPFSLMLFVTLLGRTKLVGPKPSYHALHNFVELIRDACVIADVVRELGCTSVGPAFRRKLEECDLNVVISAATRRLMNLNAVGEERARASDAVWRGLVDGKCPLPRRLSKDEKKEKRAQFVKDVEDPLRDVVYENMRLFVNHATVYLAFYEHCRWGDTGGLDESLSLQSMFFHGAKKPR